MRTAVIATFQNRSMFICLC